MLSLCINPKSFVIMCICVFFMTKKLCTIEIMGEVDENALITFHMFASLS